MKKGCRNCKFGEKVTDKQKAYALKVQAIMEKPILNSDKKKEIMTLPEYKEFGNLIGIEDLTYNELPVEIQGVDIYRVCMNDKQNEDAGIAVKAIIFLFLHESSKGGNNIHKTYYVCEYWEAEND